MKTDPLLLEEAMTKIIFSRLDPVVRQLLASIQEYRKVQQPKADDIVISKQRPHPQPVESLTNGKEYELLFQILKHQAELLQQLETKVHDTASDIMSFQTTNAAGDDPSINSTRLLFSKCLVVLADYVLLPIISILKYVRGFEEIMGTTTTAASNNNNSTPTQQRLFVIRQAAQRACVEAAARTLMAFVMAITSGGTTCSVDAWLHSFRHQTNNLTSTTLGSDKICHCLTACATALPTAKEIAQRNSQKQQQQQQQQGFDNAGEDCCDALLQAVQSLVIHTAINDNLGTNQKNNYLYGFNESTRTMAAIVQIVDVCNELMVNSNDLGEGKFCKLSSSTPSLRIRAISTIDCLLQHVPAVSMWREFFPGCFRSLYLVLLAELRLSFVTSSPKAGAASLQTLSRFLRITLARPTAIKTKQHAVSDSLLRLKHLANKTTASMGVTAAGAEATDDGNSPREAISNDIEGEDVTSARLFRYVNAFLPAHLVRLLTLLAGTRSKLLRKSAPALCLVLVRDVPSCWETTAASSYVLVSAMECCLILDNDPDDDVRSSAHAILSQIQWEHVGLNAADTVVLRIQHLIEEIPTLAQGTREADLCNRLKLITGYLNLLASLMASLSKIESKRLVARLVATVNSCRPALTDLFDIDFSSSASYSPLSADVTIVDEAYYGPPMFHFRYMSVEAVSTAEVMVQRLGELMGSRNATVFIDGCVADTVEEMSTSLESSSSVSLHELAGRLLLARNVLVGTFGAKNKPGVGTTSSPSRAERKSAKHLATLASSILPLLCSPLLLRLPETLRKDLELVPSRNGRLLPFQSGNSIQVYVNGESRVINTERPSATVSDDRAWFSCCVLEMVAVVVTALNEDIEPLTPTIVFPIFESTDPSNHQYIRRHAVFVLRRLALVSGQKDVAELARCNFDHLIGALLGRLRIPGGHFPRENKDFQELCSLSRVACFILRQASEGEKNFCAECSSSHCSSSLLKETKISLMIQFLSTLISRFDQIVARSKAAEVITAMVQVCGAAMCYLCSIHAVDQHHELTTHSPEQVTAQYSWRQDLTSLRKNRAMHGLSGLASDSAHTNHNKSSRHTGSQSSLDIDKSEIDFVSLALSRCCYALSYPELKVQVASCDCIQEGFKFLLLAYSDGESRKAVFQQVSETWPALFSRFRSISTRLFEGSSPTARLAIEGRYRKEPAVATETVVLSRLYDLIATMSEAAGDFISSRFAADIWPVTAHSLSKIIANHEERNREAPSKSVCTNNHRVREKQVSNIYHFASSSWRGLQIAVFSCLFRAFEHRACGEALSNLIPAIGITVLPFLDDDTDVGEMAVKVLKAMMRIDCDALWRPLWHLSARAYPKRALRPRDSNRLSMFEDSQCLSARRASQLLDYGDSLSEQHLDRTNLD